MPKFECMIPGKYDFEETLDYFHKHLMQSGVTTSFEDGSDYSAEKFKMAIRVYERYTLWGDNRLSMTVTLACAGEGSDIFASAISAGGSGGMIKVCGWGEEEFLSYFQEAAKMFDGMKIIKTL